MQKFGKRSNAERKSKTVKQVKKNKEKNTQENESDHERRKPRIRKRQLGKRYLVFVIVRLLITT